jgi:hypothetical protein
MRAHRVIAITVALVAFVLIWLQLHQWAAESGCADRGGRILANNICSNGEDAPWPLYSLVHPMGMLINAVIAAVFVAGAAAAIRWAARRRRGRDA